MTPEITTSAQPATANDAVLLVARLAQMLEVARINSDSDYEVTKRLVAEASSLLERHVARNSDQEGQRYEQGGLARRQGNTVRVFIEEHLTELIQVADLSALARSSPSYFSSAF